VLSRENPWKGRIGWCHACETVQMGDEARLLPMMWKDGAEDWACVNCDAEPWELGVWPDRRGYPSNPRTAAAREWEKTHPETPLV
jgi:hypothetical protein